MKTDELVKLYAKLPQVAALAKALQKHHSGDIALEGLLASSAPLLFASLAAKKQLAMPMLFILNDAEEAGYFYHDLMQLMGERQKVEASEGRGNGNVLFFPSSYRRAIKYGQRDSANEILRTEVLTALSEKGRVKSEKFPTGVPTADGMAAANSTLYTLHSTLYIVSYPEAVAELVVSKKSLDTRTLPLEKGQTVSVDAICKTLHDYGFREVDYVYEPGQYALRGSILDIFSYSHEFPFRIDFFGDEIDSIRTFEVEDQLSKEQRDSVVIVPELSLTAEDKVPFLSFLPKETVLVMKDYRYVCDAIERTWQEGFSSQAMQERLEGATEEEQYQIRCQMQRDSMLINGAQFADGSEGFRKILKTLPRPLPTGRGVVASSAGNAVDKSIYSPPSEGGGGGESFGGGSTISFHISPQPLFHKNFDMLSQTLEDYTLKGYKIYVLADSQKQTERLRDIFSNSTLNTLHSKLEFTPIDRTLHEGFVDHDLKACFFTDHQIFDRFHKYNLKSDKARSGKVALTLKEIQQFEIGDYVVHVDHGIGKFGGLVRMPIQTQPQPLPTGRGVLTSSAGNTGNKTIYSPPSKGGAGGGSAGSAGFQEMIKIIYQRGDAIYVSIHSLYKVSKYKSQDDGQQPRLSTLGTGAWERMKERTKKHIKDIARDLIRLYAARRHQRGFAYSHDTYLQHELEASFIYEDTPDQLKATQDVKADMEKGVPMDRLVCGDVGFGKTEVAVRAAFKAAIDGKQTAVLVPTTVLAYQHFRTFSSRLKDMPVRVDYLTRARSTKQVTQLLKDLEDGKIDIIIGTHKLIGKSVKFKDLGLLIIDEEQKFGVSTKEKLRQMKTNVDTLTMSATPIPRTLQFSLVGARDLSVIQTPPPNRYPIQTEIHTFSAEIIADAINFEMSRNGQVFFVNNRISDLTHIAEMIKKYIPDCRLAIGHGQMKPEELEKVVLDFSNYDYDVLLSTTIVENGIDIPNANTIIINSAQNFGLSDLHQMRGRVGRGNRKAFCYLLAPPLAALPQDARRRLEALENFSELGSGINIAMQDLDIRGAGNLLGAEQSGFISDLGYETYQKILNEAMAELKNETQQTQKNQQTHPRPLPSREGSGHSQGQKQGELQYSQAQEQGQELYTPLSVGSGWVSDCTLESDLEMYFPDQYVPSDSERMLLYRELDNTRDDRELEAYRTRLIDRFGPLPPQAEELLQVVRLRRLGKRLGCEKILLKQGRMFLYFVSNANSPFYQSQEFGSIIDYVGKNVRRCTLREQNGKRSMIVSDVPSAALATQVLTDIIGQ